MQIVCAKGYSEEMWRKLLPALFLIGCVGDDPSTTPTPTTPVADGGAGTPTDGGTTTQPTTDSGGTATANLDAFIGTWTTATAVQTETNCSPVTPSQSTFQNIQITYNVAKGSSSDLVLSNSIAPGCALKANVAGDTATLIAGNTCTDPQGTIYTYDPTSTFALASGGKTASFALKAHFVYGANESPAGESCDFTETDPLTKQ